MTITIRLAHPENDRAHIISLLRRYLGPAHDARFDWLYRENPFGPARVWIAWRASGEAVGTAALFPRRMYIGEKEETGCVMGDFCVSEENRTLGPALQLQRACMAEINSGSWAFAYDLPSRKMMAVYSRLAVGPWGKYIRFAKLLRVDEKVSDIVGQGTVSRVLSAGTNVLLTAIDSRQRIPPGTELEFHRGPYGDEFSELAQRVRTTYGNCTVRSADYLNWRYLAHPFRSYEMVTARYEGTLCGYVVFSQFDTHAVVADLLAVPERSVIEALLRELASQLRPRGVTTVNCACLNSSALVPMLRRAGFREREASPVLLWQPRHAGPDLPSVESQNWLLLEGDRES
jgi:hypothetical protein